MEPPGEILNMAPGEAEPPHRRGSATQRIPLGPRHNAKVVAAAGKLGLLPLWVLTRLVGVELKPKAGPTFSSKGVADRVSLSSLCFYGWY